MYRAPALCLVSGVLLAFTFHGDGIHLLAPFALVPLLWALAQLERGWQRFLYGWAAGILYWFIVCTWIQFVLEVHGGMGKWGGWATFLLFCMLKALHLGVFSWFAGPLMRRPYALPAVAALWTGLERTHATFGFAWLDLGNAAIDMALPLRLAPFVGVYGMSFLFCTIAAGMACLALRAPRTWLLPLLALPLLWLLPALPAAEPAPSRAVIVQPNIDTEVLWTSLLQYQVDRQLTQISNALAGPIVIWPELPAPLYFYSDHQFHDDAVDVARRHGAFLFGTVASDAHGQPLNSAVMLSGDGAEVGRYDKIDLVPFGEFVPPLFSWVNRITQETSDFVPGHDIKVLNAAGHRFGVFICYESAFPDLVRQFTKRGADVLANISNDGYFGHSQARQQHLSLARMRAVENRRFLIRATNDGITAVIDPAGRIVRELPPYQEVATTIEYGGVSEVTFYSQHGDWFAWSCLAAGLALAAISLRR